jgi:hypothetical protein
MKGNAKVVPMGIKGDESPFSPEQGVEKGEGR